MTLRGKAPWPPSGRLAVSHTDWPRKSAPWLRHCIERTLGLQHARRGHPGAVDWRYRMRLNCHCSSFSSARKTLRRLHAARAYADVAKPIG
jgi:hypothetical protein